MIFSRGENAGRDAINTEISPSAAIFSELLILNPWAVDLWERKTTLVSQGAWNLHSLNQAGNKLTSEWLDEFKDKRRAATRSRLEGPRNDWDIWSSETQKLITPLRNRPDFPRYLVGSKVWSNKLSEYTIGSLWADIHLLADADLSNEEVQEALDISGFAFPASLHAGGMSALKEFRAEHAKFGDHTSFHCCVFAGETSFRNALFGSWNGFAMAEFLSSATFEGAKFGFEGSFTATAFWKSVNFKNALFEGSAPFCGANFRGEPDFSNTRFMGQTDFSDATFSNGAIFDDAWFPDTVLVHAIAEDVIDAIRKADHSKSRPMRA